jgi:hypothetical protein
MSGDILPRRGVRSRRATAIECRTAKPTDRRGLLLCPGGTPSPQAPLGFGSCER